MEKRYLIFLLLIMFLMPFEVFASGGFGVSSTNVTMYPGESKTITISTNDSVGKLDISSSNGSVATVNPGSVFIDSIGASKTFTITGSVVGSATISVVGTDNYASFSDEVSLKGMTKNITVNVIEKPVPQPDPVPQPEPTPSPDPAPQPAPESPQVPQNTLSGNNNIKSISVEGYELVKVDNNNYTLTVLNNVVSVNVIASAEDVKATISGNGIYELQVGENNIEVIVTAESGVQNKFNIKVIRKDGYYLEDLNIVLKDDKLNVADIIINADSKITKEQINKIKDSKKILNFNYYNENKKLLYSWIINGKEIKKVIEITSTIAYTSDNTKEIYKLSNYADGLYINFNHSGDLPNGTKIKLYVGDKFENDSNVNVYHYDDKNKTLDFIEEGLIVTDGYIEFDIEHCSLYFVTMSTIADVVKIEKSSSNMFILFTIIELIIIIVLIIFIKIRTTKNKNMEIKVPNFLGSDVDDSVSNNSFNKGLDASNNNDIFSNNNGQHVEENNNMNLDDNTSLNQEFSVSNNTDIFSNNNVSVKEVNDNDISYDSFGEELKKLNLFDDEVENNKTDME